MPGEIVYNIRMTKIGAPEVTKTIEHHLIHQLRGTLSAWKALPEFKRAKLTGALSR